MDPFSITAIMALVAPLFIKIMTYVIDFLMKRNRISGERAKRWKSWLSELNKKYSRDQKASDNIDRQRKDLDDQMK